MAGNREMRRIEMQRLIKAYLLFNGEATSRELAIWLDRNFGYRHSLTVDDVRRMLMARNRPVWLKLEYIKGTKFKEPNRWRLKE
jgi:hypothetical protein